jgi:hypothetical protein
LIDIQIKNKLTAKNGKSKKDGWISFLGLRFEEEMKKVLRSVIFLCIKRKNSLDGEFLIK